MFVFFLEKQQVNFLIWSFMTDSLAYTCKHVIRIESWCVFTNYFLNCKRNYTF